MFDMYKSLKNFFKAQPENHNLFSIPAAYAGINGFQELFNQFEGQSFSNGLYRLHSVEEFDKWNEIVSDAFPGMQGRIFCFGYDWLGRHYSLDPKRVVKSQPQILMYEPGSGEALEIPCSFYDFHEKEIPKRSKNCLASEFFREWITVHSERITLDKCVGYKVPLFLGGEDDIDNLELSDMDVYWSICSQLIKSI